jgi:hypothetical protein
MTGQWQPLLLTTARWLNSRKRTQGRDLYGNRVYGWKWAKVLAHTGPYGQFTYGCDHPSDWPDRGFARRRELQVCIINYLGSGAMTMDVDDEQQFLNTRTGQLIGRADAISVHTHRTPAGCTDHFHILIDARGVSEADWPVQGMIDSANHIKSKGFIPAPGCKHWDSELYEPVPGWRGPVPWSPRLIAAIHADLEQERQRRDEQRRRHGGGGSGGGGEGGGRDGDVAATVLGNILRGLSKEQCYAEWRKIAIPRDPGWEYTREDFERHYGDETRGALAKARRIQVADREAYDAWKAETGGMLP